MKKILTLFAMSLLSWGMLSAQTKAQSDQPALQDPQEDMEFVLEEDFPFEPTFNFQAVIRDVDTLFHDQTVNAKVQIVERPRLLISDLVGQQPVIINNNEVTNGQGVYIPVADVDNTIVYTEDHDGLKTSKNGLVSLVIGNGEVDPEYTTIYNFFQVDWSNAFIVVTFTDEDEYELQVDTINVTAVPYALQSGSAKLSTEQIAEYAANVLEQADVTEIVNTIVANEELKDAIKAKLLDYLKSADGKANAMKVAEDYLTHLDSINIREVCDALDANGDVKEAVKNLVKQFIMDNRELAKELAFWFLEYQLDDNDIQRAYNTMMQVSPAVKQAVRTRVKNYLLAQNNRHYLYDLGVYFLGTITEDQALYVYNQYFRFENETVKAHLRDGLDEYILGYLDFNPSDTPNATHGVEKAATTYAAANLLLLPACFSDMTRDQLVQLICSLQH